MSELQTTFYWNLDRFFWEISETSCSSAGDNRMAYTSIFRKSASSLAPLVGRIVGGRRHYHSALFTAINHRANLSRRPSLRSPLVPTLHYSSDVKRPLVDETLIQTIDSEIGLLQEADDYDRVEEIPSGFPFKIDDNPGHHTVILKRMYQGEEIEVEVNMPYLVTEQDHADHDFDADSEKLHQSSLPIVVSVSKKSEPSLEFTCTAYPDEIVIDSLSVSRPEISEDDIYYKGPDFKDLDENLQKAFHKYLEMRGIKPSTLNFLHEYMINKNSREEFNWLKKLKKFVEA